MAYNNQNNNQQNNQNTQNTQNTQNNGRQTMVPEARGALDNMKYEIAGELGIQLNQG